MTEPEPPTEAENAPIELGEDGKWRHPDGTLVAAHEAGIRGQRETVDHSLTVTGGWCSPSAVVVTLDESGAIPEVEIPNPRTPRGGIKYSEARIPDSAKPNPPRLTYGAGRWEYAVDTADYDDGDTEPDIVSGWGTAWDPREPFTSLQEAADYHPGGKLFERWVPAPGPWDEVKP